MDEGKNLPDTTGVGLADRICGLSSSDLQEYVTECLRRRDLHVVVQRLNVSVLSEAPENAVAARKALHRLGFVD